MCATVCTVACLRACELIQTGQIAVREGDNARRLAEEFAAQHGLPASRVPKVRGSHLLHVVHGGGTGRRPNGAV